MNDIELGNPERFGWLWLVAAQWVLVVLAAAANRRARRRFASANLIGQLFRTGADRRRVLATILSSATLALLVVCIVDIRWGKIQREVPQKGIEIMFALDVSRSMLAEDVSPNRLDRAKQMIRDTLDELVGDRVGLTIFAGDAKQQIPLTKHYDDFKQALDEVGPGMLSRGGSRLGIAIESAADGFLEKTTDHKAIVLITDGEDQQSEPMKAAISAKQDLGVRIFTIGLGDSMQGARIPLKEDGRPSFLQHEGQQVWSRLDGEILAKVATETGGAYIPAGTKRVSMADVYHGYIANVPQTEFETARIDSFEARFQWFLAPALMLLVADLLLVPTRPSM